MLYHIYASTNNHIIGVNNTLPWHYSEDFKWFKNKTLNHLIVMGSKTFDSLPVKPLANRFNIVITQNEEKLKISSTQELIYTKDINQILSWSKIKDVYIIGGSEIFKLFPNPDVIYRTLVPDIELDNKESISYYPFEILSNYSLYKEDSKDNLKFQIFIKNI